MTLPFFQLTGAMGDQGPQPHKKGKQISYATTEWRNSFAEEERIARAKGGTRFMGSARNREASQRFNNGNKGHQISNINPQTFTAGFGTSQGIQEGGGAGGGIAWTPQGEIASFRYTFDKMMYTRGAGQRQVSQANYLYGGPSVSMIEKYGRWGEGGPQNNQGWRGTLTQAAAPQSTIRNRQSHNNEVVQTRETRRKSDLQPFMTLQMHSNTPRLNPNLSYMYGQKTGGVGAVRRTVTRRL